MNWMTAHARDFVDQRTHGVPERTKIAFLEALQEVSASDSPSLDLIHISPAACDVFRTSALSWDNEEKALLGGLTLIAINKNQPLVKAVAANYRRCAARRQATTAANAVSVPPANDQPASDRD